ncbi:hypothetical protein DUNSADRAFT_17691 [Dunaliella salina]|nr:hypothetical protein DUNSADRAFT_17691 [Dunaliella salina]|eukprot:KAF5828375.1 hypothetical protein DUNSADRAFT_17691 [Dunaliella salina]
MQNGAWNGGGWAGAREAPGVGAAPGAAAALRAAAGAGSVTVAEELAGLSGSIRYGCIDLPRAAPADCNRALKVSMIAWASASFVHSLMPFCVDSLPLSVSKYTDDSRRGRLLTSANKRARAAWASSPGVKG